MTRQEFEQNKKELKPFNDVLNYIAFFDLITAFGAIIWAIWGGGSSAWKLLATAVLLFIFVTFIYYLTCYKYYKDGAEQELITEGEEPEVQQPDIPEHIRNNFLNLR